jgi:glutathione S-transferase
VSRESPGAGGGDSETRRVFYRCPTPSNFLCPCGAVARRLRKLDLEHEVERVAYRRGARPEIEELTRPSRVPVFVDGDEVIYDSKRILEYLDWRYAEPDSGSPRSRSPKGEGEPGRR